MRNGTPAHACVYVCVDGNNVYYFFSWHFREIASERRRMASTNEPIKLIIRTANNQHADFELELLPLLTVYDLKQKITTHHPTKSVRRFAFFLSFLTLFFFSK